MRSPPSAARSRTRGQRTATGPMPVMISRSGRCPWRTSRARPSSVSLSVWPPRKPATSASTACASSARAPLRNTSVNRSENAPGWDSLMRLSWVMAYHSFGGEVEASNTPTIRRLTPSRRHQLLRITHTQAICGPHHARGHFRRAHRWGKTKGKIGFHGGKVEIERPRLRDFNGKELAVQSWEAAVAEDWLGKWSMNQMLINVATRKYARSVRLPGGDVPASAGAGLSKSAVSRRFVALSAARMKEWMASDLSGLDLLVIQIDGIHMDEDMILVAACALN